MKHTLNDLIEELEAARDAYGGDIPVQMESRDPVEYWEVDIVHAAPTGVNIRIVEIK